MLGEDLLEAIAFASSLGVFTRLVTNAQWAVDFVAARTMITDLRACGLDELNFSWDRFHAEWIDPKNLVHAWAAAKGAGFSTVLIATLATPGVPNPGSAIEEILGERIQTVSHVITSREDLQGYEDITVASDGSRYLISVGSLAALGRARSLDADWPRADDRLPLYGFGGCPHVLTDLSLFPNNDLGACCGFRVQGRRHFDLGSLSGRSLAQVVRESGDDFILKAVRQLGPGYLLKVLETVCNIHLNHIPCTPCEACAMISLNSRLVSLLEGQRSLIENDLAVLNRVARRVSSGECAVRSVS